MGVNNPHDVTETEKRAVTSAYNLLESVYGETFRNHAEEREPDMTRWIIEEGIDLSHENVARIAEVMLYKTIGGTKPYLYDHWEQDPFENSVYGI